MLLSTEVQKEERDICFPDKKKLVPASRKVSDFENIQEALIARDERTVNGKIVVKV